MFDLHKIGWHAFQRLCLTVAREVLGQTVESFLDTNDGGRDGAFTGTWQTQAGENLSGKFVIQCKFSSRPDHLLTVSELADEFAKVEALVGGGLCDAYVLITNAGVSGATAGRITTALANAGVKQSLILGSTWLTEQIQASKRLRMMVPRIYGLGDLSQILDERAYQQAKAVLESMREELSKVVITDAYAKAADALDTHGFVLLVGEPAAGKTTIASMLAMAAADKYNASVVKVTRAGPLVDRWNTGQPDQFFWVDDAFGALQYETQLALEFNSFVQEIKAAIQGGAKIVLTSRDYVYRAARSDLKTGAFPLLRESQVVVDVQELKPVEREQILYNHLKFGSQPRSFLRDIKPYLGDVAAHLRFIPEMAKRLADPTFTKNLSTTQEGLLDFIERREEFLIEVIRGLDVDSRAALALIYMRKDDLRSPIALEAAEQDALMRLGSSLGKCIVALESMKGSLVVQTAVDDAPSWRFRHPTIGDAFAAIVRGSVDLLDVYLRGAAVDLLMEQVTCGDVGLENTVIVPPAMFGLFIERLNEHMAMSDAAHRSWEARRELYAFLRRRSSRAFCARYLEAHPELPGQLESPGLFLDAVPEVPLVLRLHELGLFPEASRRRFVEKVAGYAIAGEDCSALGSPTLKAMFTPTERAWLIREVQEEFVPRLEEVREELEVNYSRGDDPADHMAYFLKSLDALEDAFSQNAAILVTVRQERFRAEDWISDHSFEEESASSHALGDLSEEETAEGSRSIFDDIDE